MSLLVLLIKLMKNKKNNETLFVCLFVCLMNIKITKPCNSDKSIELNL